MAQTVYNLDADWSGLDQDTRWVFRYQDLNDMVTLDQLVPENDISVKIQVSTAQLSANFSSVAWEWSPGAGETVYYLDSEGATTSDVGANISAAQITFGNFFKTSDDADAAGVLLKAELADYHNDLGY